MAVRTPSMTGFGVLGDFVQVDFTPPIAVVATAYDLLAFKVRTLRPVLERAVREVVIPSLRETYDTEGRGTWEALSPYTLAAKTGATGAAFERLTGVGGAYGGDVPILVSTALQRKTRGKGMVSKQAGSLKRKATSLSIWSYTQDTAFVGKEALPWYGVVHQFGTIGGGFGSTPARPFLVLQFEDLDNIDRVFQDWVREKALQVGFT